MIENLNNITFAGYGKVEQHGFNYAIKNLAFDIIKEKSIEDKSIPFLYINKTEKTVLERLDGTAVMFVGIKQDEMKMFLLDKTVIINSGVYFCVTPLFSTAKISIASKFESMERVESEQNSVHLGLVQSFDVTKIHTLFYQEREFGFKSQPETHDFWELTYVDKGYIYNEVGGKTYRLNQGSLMFISPNQDHTQYTEPTVAACYITVSFSMSFNEPNILNDLIFQADDEIKAILKKLLYEKEYRAIYSDDLLLCYIKELVIYFIRQNKIEALTKSILPLEKTAVENEIIIKAQEYIKKNIFSKISVDTTARTIPISSSYLSTLFKQHVNITVKTYILDLKMEHAKDLIRQNKYSFTQISEMLSFNTIHHFSAQFKKYYNLTPSEYANSLQR